MSRAGYKISEKAVINEILRYANKHQNCFLYKYHGGQYSKNGFPDLFGAIDGKFVAVECKSPSGKLTILQKQTLDELKRKGACVGVARNLFDFKELLEQHQLSLQ
jgi:hypothetical protein